MFLLNFFIFLIIYYSEACYKLPNCDYSIFESQIKYLKYDNKNINNRLNMMQSLLDNQTEFLVHVETKIDLIQQSLQFLESKLPGLGNHKPPQQAEENEVEVNVVVTMPNLNIYDIEDKYDIDEYSDDICPVDHYPSDCSQSKSKFCAEGKCRIQNQLFGKQSFMVSCDVNKFGRGWTVIQRRINGSIDFYRNWSEYKNGFGNIDGEFFIGLDKLYALTNTMKPVELLILLEDFKRRSKYAKYNGFTIGSEKEKYKLIKVGKYSGNAGDSFSQHQGCNYTTKDRDNDMEPNFNCAANRLGAWWYKKCFFSHLNGVYYGNGKVPRGKAGITWSTFNGYDYSLKSVKMMIRPKRRT